MAYTRGIPSANQPTSLWQKQERRNGFVRDDVIGEDHYPPSDPENGGKHRKFTLPNESSDPTTLTDEYALYTKEDTGIQSIYGREPSSGTVAALISDDTFGSVQKMGSIVLGASCLIDTKGNVFNSYNVSNITITTPAPPAFITYQVNFTNTLPTDDYFWTVEVFNSPGNAPNTFLLSGIYVSGATYASSVTDQFIKFTAFNSLQGVTQPRNKFNVKIWMVA